MSYTTNHDTANNCMEHDFGNGNSVLVDRNRNMAFKYQKTVLIESISIIGIGIDRYLATLLKLDQNFNHTLAST